MMRIRSNLRDLKDVPLSEIFILFALTSLVLFPLVFCTNRVVADSGFVFAFLCLSAGTVLKMIQVGGWLPPFKSSIFSRNGKLMIFIALSLILLYLGYIWLGIFGSMFFSLGIIVVILLAHPTRKKIVISKEREGYCFGRRDIYYLGALLLLNLFSIRKLLTTEPIVYWDWSGFGLNALDAFRLWGTQLPDPYAFLPVPLILLMGNELAGNVFLLAWIPIAGITFYCLATRVLRNRVAGFVASFTYTFNPAVLDRFLSAHVGMLIGYAMMPLILLFFISALENRNFRVSLVFSVIAGALLAFSGLLQYHFYYLHALLLLLFLIFYSAMGTPHENLRRGVPLLASVFSTAAILASPWLIFFTRRAISGQYSSTATLSYLESLSSQSYLYNIFRLIGQSGAPFMDGLGYTGFSIYPLLGFLTVLLGFSGLVLHKEKKERMVLIFSVVALIGVVLSTGTKYTGLYQWLYLNFPFFIAFREPSKFLVLAGFGLSMLVGISADAFLSLRSSNVRFAKFSVPLFLSIVLLSHSIFAWPMFTGDNMLYSQHPRYSISRDYRELGAWMDSQEEFYKVIVLPYTGFTFRTWHFVSSKPIVLINTSSISPSEAHQYSTFMFETLERGDVEGFAVLSGLKGVKYVVVQGDLDLRHTKETPDDYGYIPPFNRFNISGPSLIQTLQESSEFEKRQEFGPYAVFENRRFLKSTGKKKPILAIGDRNLILEMAQRPDLDFTKNELIFASQLKHKELTELIKSTEVISNSDENELLFSLLGDEYKIDVYEYAFPAGLGDDPRNIIYKKWIRSDIFEFLEGGVFGRGAITYGRGYAITRGNAILRMPFYSTGEGPRQVWVRLLYAPNRGELNVLVDDEKVGEVSPESSDFRGFIWVKMGDVDITQGTHNVKILNLYGENVIDQIAFLPR